MSGNIGEKARAAFLALIMVTSVMAAGVAFSGSAAALEDPKTDDDGNPVSGAAGGLVVADPANPGDNTVHNASVELASSSALTGDSANDPSSLQNITINYSQADVDFDLEDPGSTGASQNNISDITVTIDRNSVDLSTLENTKGDDAAVQIDNANDQIFVDFGFNDNSISLPETNSTGQPDISPGSKIFVEIDGTSTDGTFANAEDANGQSTVTMELGSQSTNAVESNDLTLELPGAVEVYEDQHTTDGTPAGNYTTISDAISGDVDADDLIAVGDGEYREFGNTINLASDNVTVEGTNQPFINVSSGNAVDIQAGDVVINNFEIRGADNSDTIRQTTVSDADTFTNISDSLVHVRGSSSQSVGLRSQGPVDVDNVEFAGQDKSNNGYGVWVVSDANNANIASSTFTNLSVGIQTTAQNGLQVSDNTFDEIGATAVIVASGNGDQDTDNVDVTGNSITNASYAFWVNDRDDNDNVVQVNITDNTVTGTGSETGALIQAGEVDLLSNELTDLQNATDVQAQNVNGELDIQSNTVHNASTGLYVAGDPASTDNLNVHFNEYTENTDGVVVNSDFGSESGDLLNVTFNDFVDTESNALNVTGSINGQVNANYSWWDNRDYSRIVGPYTPQNAGSQLPSPRRVYSYTRLHTGGQP